MESRSLLLVGVDDGVADSVTRAATRLSFEVETTPDTERALERIASRSAEPALIVLGVAGPEEAGPDLLKRFRGLTPGVPVVMTAATASFGLIVEALKSGAVDFVSQPATDDHWEKSLAAALNGRGPARPVSSVSGAFVGRSPGMTAIAATLSQIAWSDAPVLIQGETGCGKEVLARALHAESQRAKKPFFKLNCAALPSELVESELFGYERGAFTGAFQRKPGIFEAADGGTILLDEIGDMDIRLQAKLLQVLQDQAFQRIGGKEPIQVDVRVVAATHRDLEKGIDDGSFREDLYYRLNVVNIFVPPLRERRTDLFDLTEVLLKKHAKASEPLPTLSAGLREAMLAWHWPGNVRELENFARKLLIFRDSEISERELRERLRRHGSAAGAVPQSVAGNDGPDARTAQPDGGLEPLRVPEMAEVNRVTQRAEAEAIISALNTARWNRRVAAELLHIDYKALLYRMKKLGIAAPKAPRPASGPATRIPASPERNTCDCPQANAAAARSTAF